MTMIRAIMAAVLALTGGVVIESMQAKDAGTRPQVVAADTRAG